MTVNKKRIREFRCFNVVANVLGFTKAQEELLKVVYSTNFYYENSLLLAFTWADTPQGLNFWSDISSGIDPRGGYKRRSYEK